MEEMQHGFAGRRASRDAARVSSSQWSSIKKKTKQQGVLEAGTEQCASGNRPSSSPFQGPNSVFEVYLVGNNSNHFIISPTSIQGKADIRVRVAVPLDFETIPRYEFSVWPRRRREG